MKISELKEEFIIRYMERRLKPSTIRGYRINLEKHFLPAIEGIWTELEDIDVEMLDVLTDVLAQKGLSSRTIVYVHATVRKMMNYARKRGYIDLNPYDQFDMPRVYRYHYRVLPEDEIERMLLSASGTDLEVPITLALCYGLRRGEILGIIPVFDVDLKRSVLHVQRTRTVEQKKMVLTDCKTQNSNRHVLISPTHMMRLLKLSGDSFLCELTPMQLEYRFKRFLMKYNFPKMRFHDLRHTYATFMLSKGVNPKIVSTVLGHSGVGVTLDIYSHPDVSMQQICLDFLPK